MIMKNLKLTKLKRSICNNFFIIILVLNPDDPQLPPKANINATMILTNLVTKHFMQVKNFTSTQQTLREKKLFSSYPLSETSPSVCHKKSNVSWDIGLGGVLPCDIFLKALLLLVLWHLCNAKLCKVKTQIMTMMPKTELEENESKHFFQTHTRCTK